LSVSSLHDDTAGDYVLVIKVQDVNKEQLVDTLEALGDQVVDAHEV